MIRPSLADPPALILASRRSLRRRACSAAEDAAGLDDDCGEELTYSAGGDGSSIFVDVFDSGLVDVYVILAGFEETE